MSPIRAVFFDVGETLVSEQRMWSGAAETLGISELELFASLGAAIDRRERHEQVFERFGLVDGETIISIGQQRAKSGAAPDFSFSDLYPDALPALSSLKALGLFVGIAANQPSARGDALLCWSLPVDSIDTSERWGVSKPAPEFFAKICEVAGVPASEVMYVGDRVDNDVLPANKAGMTSVLLRRGPWGQIQSGWPEAASADYVIDSLEEVVDLLRPN